MHLPKNGTAGGWYVQMGSLVLPAPIQDVVWEGAKVTGKALVPGQQPMALSGTLDEATGKLELEMGGGTLVGTPAEAEAARSVVPRG